MLQKNADLSMLTRAEPTDRPDEAGATRIIIQPPSRWKTRLGVPILILTVTAVLLLSAAWDVLAPALPVRVLPVIVRSDIAGGATMTVQAPGWVEPDPFSIAVPALADGVIEDVLVLEGQPVKSGEVVARMVDDDARLALERAESEWAQRDAEQKTAEAALEAAQRDWDNPIELTRRLETSKAMLAERRAELARWPAELAAEQAREGELRAEFDRLRTLHENQQAGEIEFIRSRQQYERQRAVVEAVKSRKAIIEAQIAAMQAEVAAAEENLRLRIPERRALDTARADLDRARAAVERARAARDEARLRLDRMQIISPVDGIVMRREVEPGSKMIMGSDQPHSLHTIHLYDPQRLQVRVDVPLGEAANVGVGQKAEVVVNVLPDRVYHGEISRVVHEADIQKNTLQVKVAIHDPSPELKPEMLARVTFLAPQPPPGAEPVERVFAPKRLIRTSSGRSGQVWVVAADGEHAELSDVTVGTGHTNGWVEVAQGLRPGDWLIAEPATGLKDGDRIEIVGEINAEIESTGTGD